MTTTFKHFYETKKTKKRKSKTQDKPYMKKIKVPLKTGGYPRGLKPGTGGLGGFAPYGAGGFGYGAMSMGGGDGGGGGGGGESFTMIGELLSEQPLNIPYGETDQKSINNKDIKNPQPNDNRPMDHDTSTEMSDEDEDEDEDRVKKEDETDPTVEEDPNRVGLIRRVQNAHMVYKRKGHDGLYEELWTFFAQNADDKFKDSINTRDAILAGTDINPDDPDHNDESETTYDIWTAGNAQIMKITGLPN